MSELTVEQFERRTDTYRTKQGYTPPPFTRSLDELVWDPKESNTKLKDLAANIMVEYTINDFIPLSYFAEGLKCPVDELNEHLNGVRCHLKRGGLALKMTKCKNGYLLVKFVSTGKRKFK